MDNYNIAVNGCNDNKPYDQILERSWTFRTIGYGHDLKFWKDFVSVLRLVGYDYVVSIEHEDAMMSTEEGLSKLSPFSKKPSSQKHQENVLGVDNDTVTAVLCMDLDGTLIDQSETAHPKDF